MSDRQLMDDCGVMSAMTATGSGKDKFDFFAETCFLKVCWKRPTPSIITMKTNELKAVLDTRDRACDGTRCRSIAEGGVMF